jgi:hypothetical protein
MPTFVTLAKWTDEGIRNIKDSPKRRQSNCLGSLTRGTGSGTKRMNRALCSIAHSAEWDSRSKRPRTKENPDGPTR